MGFLSPRTGINTNIPQKASLLRTCFSFVKKISKRTSVGILALIIFVALGVVLPASQALAVTKTSTLSPGDQASSFAYYKALRACMSMGFYKNSWLNYPSNSMSQQNAIDAYVEVDAAHDPGHGRPLQGDKKEMSRTP